MAERQRQLGPANFLEGSALPAHAVEVNRRVWFRDCQGLRAVFVEQTPFYTYSPHDAVEHRFCAAQLVEAGLAFCREVCEAFQISPRTLARVRNRLRQGGLAALVPGTPGPRSRRGHTHSVTPAIVRMYQEGKPICDIVQFHGLSRSTVRRVLRDQGVPLRRPQPLRQHALFADDSSDAIAPGQDAPENGDEAGGIAPAAASLPEAVSDGCEAAVLSTYTNTLQPLSCEEPQPVPQESPEACCDAASAGEFEAETLATETSSAVGSSEADGEPCGEASSAATAAIVTTAAVQPQALSAGEEQAIPRVEATSIPYASAVDRFAMAMGWVEEAPVDFRSASGVRQAGVLLGLALLGQTHLMSEARAVYGRLNNGWYGLRSLIWSLLVMALLRIKRPEQLKKHDPASLGCVLGLPRAAEVKTIRRKLEEIAQRGLAAQWHRRLAMRRAEDHGSELATLYIDGHVRVYQGKRRIGKTYVTRTKSVMRGETDYWVHMADGEPLLVVHDAANMAFAEVLQEQVLPEIRRLVGKRRVRVVFDRGGWSRELFWGLLQEGFDFLTYRKGPYSPVEESLFQPVTLLDEGRPVRYELAEAVFEEEGWPKLRLIAVKKTNGKQTHVLATGRSTWEATGQSPEELADYVDAPAAELSWRMFGRWSQENWFKYMDAEYALDVLLDYDVEADNPERQVPNPQWRKLDRQVKAAREELQRARARYARLALAQKSSSGKKKAADCGSCGKCVPCKMQHQAAVVQRCEEAYARVCAERQRTPREIRLGDVDDRDPVKLRYEGKLFTDTVKLGAYEIETALYGMLPGEFRRHAFEGRSLVRDILQATGDLHVCGDRLEVHLEQLSAPRYTQALQWLCEQVNDLAPILPETSLRLRFFVKPRPVGE